MMRVGVMMLLGAAWCAAALDYASVSQRKAVAALCATPEFSNCVLQIGGVCPPHVERELKACGTSCSLADSKVDTHKLSGIHTDIGESISIVDVHGNSDDTFVRVDLRQIIERYTGYQGGAMWKTMHTIARADPLADRLLRGIHCSVTIHLCAFFNDDPDKRSLYMNYKMMREKVDPKYLPDLEFAVQFLLSLLPTCVGDIEAIARTQKGKESVNYLKASLWNTGANSHTQYQVSPIAVDKCGEISGLVPCIDCLRCKIWGKVQIEGLKSSLKLLLRSKRRPVPLNTEDFIFYLNLINRLSTAMTQYEKFQHDEANLLAAREARQDQKATAIDQLGAVGAVGLSLSRPFKCKNHLNQSRGY